MTRIPLLLDSHVLLWVCLETERLSHEAKNLLLEAEEVFISAVSLWELGIKASVKKTKLNARELAELAQQKGYKILPVEVSHIEEMMKLPFHHRDPFDRMLVAQAHAEGLTLLTADRRLVPYGKCVKTIERR